MKVQSFFSRLLFLTQYGGNNLTSLKEKIWFRVFTFLLLAELAFSTAALSPQKQINQYIYDNWTLADGLPQSSVLDILQSRDGYIWLATLEGLVRFDGVKFVVFDKTNVPGAASHQITALCEDQDGALWVGTMEGGLWRVHNGFFQIFTTEHGLANNHVLTLCLDSAGDLWAGGENSGLSRLKRNESRFSSFYNPGKFPESGIRAILEDRSGSLWLGSDSGLIGFNPQRGVFTRLTVDNGLADNKIYCLFTDSGGFTWVGCENGLSRLDLRGGEPAIIPWSAPGNEKLTGAGVRDIFEDRNGSIWLGVYERGLRRLIPTTSTSGQQVRAAQYIMEKGLTEFKIDSILADREDNLWIGALDGGLNRLRDGAVTSWFNPKQSNGPPAYAILADSSGTIWFSSDIGPVRLLPYSTPGEAMWETTSSTLPGLSNNTVWTLCFQDANTLWMGTQNGLNRMDIRTGAISRFTVRDGLTSNIIRAIERDEQNTLWIGADRGGLTCFQNNRFISIPSPAGLESYSIWTLCAGRNNTLWIGTWGGGLIRYKNNQFTIFSGRSGLSAAIITAIYEEQPNQLWIGSYGGGLYYFDGRAFFPITSRQGLADDTIHAILGDNRGNLWMSCNKGIFSASIHDLRELQSGQRSHIHCFIYNEADGMKSRECNGVGHPSAWKDTKGRLWFPTNNGPVMINPQKLPINRIIPPVYVETIIADNRSLTPPFSSPGQPLRFSPGTDSFEFHYTALSYSSPRDVHFKIRLDGFDSTWNQVDNRRVAYYRKLPPGDYTFRVTACNNDGYWNETGAAVFFRLEPHFFQTRWFIGLTALGVVLLLFSAYFIRIRRLKNQANLLKQLVDEQTFNLTMAREAAEQAREIAEKANMAKSEFLANVSHEIRTPMNAILGFSEILSEKIQEPKLREYLNSITNGGQTLLRLINNILDLSRIESGKIKLDEEPLNIHNVLHEIADIFRQKAQSKGLDLRVEIAPGVPEGVKMDGLRIRQVLLNLIGNAIKFTDSGFVRISLRQAPSTTGAPTYVSLVFSIQDTGIGVPPSQHQRIFEAFMQQEGQKEGQYEGSGLGLAIAQRLARLMNGYIRLESNTGVGSLFEVFIPDLLICAVSSLSASDFTPEIADVRFHPSVILVVDNTEPNRRLIREYLENSPITLLEAENGRSGIEMARSHRPNLILMDIKMPVLNGLDATRVLKNDNDLKHIPVILITASILKEDWTRIMSAGGNGFMLKPIQKFDLYIELMQFLPYSTPHMESPAETRMLNNRTPLTAADIIATARINPDCLHRIPELLEILKKTELLEKWEQVRKYYIVDEFESFAAYLIELEKEFNTGLLGAWTEKLTDDLNQFDLERIKCTLDSFPALAERLKYFTNEMEK